MFFAIISYSGLSSATLLHVYLGNLPKETPVRDNFAIFFIWMLMNKGRLVKAFIGKYLSLRGREVKTTVLTSILGGSRTGPVQLSLVRI